MWKVRIRNYSGSYFPAFGLNMERYSISLYIQYKCGKARTRKFPNTNTFHTCKSYTWKYLSPLYWFTCFLHYAFFRKNYETTSAKLYFKNLYCDPKLVYMLTLNLTLKSRDFYDGVCDIHYLLFQRRTFVKKNKKSYFW